MINGFTYLLPPKKRFRGHRFFKIRLVLPAIALMTIHACNHNVLFDDTKTIPESVWYDNQIIRFDVMVEDSASNFSFYLNVRHSTDYRYANLFLFISTTYPDGYHARDTVECILADRSGKWIGRGISNIRDNQVLLRRGLRFPKSGRYIFEIEQAMREPELEGIKDVGLRIVKE